MGTFQGMSRMVSDDLQDTHPVLPECHTIAGFSTTITQGPAGFLVEMSVPATHPWYGRHAKNPAWETSVKRLGSIKASFRSAKSAWTIQMVPHRKHIALLTARQILLKARQIRLALCMAAQKIAVDTKPLTRKPETQPVTPKIASRYYPYRVRIAGFLTTLYPTSRGIVIGLAVDASHPWHGRPTHSPEWERIIHDLGYVTSAYPDSRSAQWIIGLTPHEDHPRYLRLCQIQKTLCITAERVAYRPGAKKPPAPAVTTPAPRVVFPSRPTPPPIQDMRLTEQTGGAKIPAQKVRGIPIVAVVPITVRPESDNSSLRNKQWELAHMKNDDILDFSPRNLF